MTAPLMQMKEIEVMVTKIMHWMLGTPMIVHITSESDSESNDISNENVRPTQVRRPPEWARRTRRGLYTIWSQRIFLLCFSPPIYGTVIDVLYVGFCSFIILVSVSPNISKSRSRIDNISSNASLCAPKDAIFKWRRENFPFRTISFLSSSIW